MKTSFRFITSRFKHIICTAIRHAHLYVLTMSAAERRPQVITRRELKLGIQRVELRLYRRTRTSSEIHIRRPHFVYTIKVHWEGDPLPRDTSTRPRSASPQASPRHSPMSPRSPDGKSLGFEDPWPWWDPLPTNYTIKRRWRDIVRFHESLKVELANDPVLDCRRVKAKDPVLPTPADVDAWLKSYAATNDACALGRTATEVLNREFAPCFNELGDLHWTYCHNRLVPYFNDATKVLEEVPTEILASSRALRRFVTGGVSGRPPPSALPVPPRFLGKLLPVLPDGEEISRAARELQKSNSLSTLSRPRTTDDVSGRPRKSSQGSMSNAPLAAAKLMVKQ